MRPRLVLLIALTMVLLSACELEAVLRLEVAEDGSGRVIARFGLDDEFKELIESSGENVEDSIFEDNEILGEIPGSEQRVYEEGDFTYYEASAPFADTAALDALVAEGQADNPLGDLDVQVDEDRAVVRGSIPLDDFAAEDDGLAGVDPEALTEFFSLSVQVLMPGEVTSHNADRMLDDGTLEWDIPLLTTEQALEIEAESDPTGSGGSSLGLIVIIAVVVAAVVVAALWFMRRRGGTPEPAAVGAGAVDPAAPAPAPPAAAPDAPVPEMPGETPPSPER